MTDRIAGFVVSLENDMRADDAEATIAAIRQIRGVVNVTPVEGGRVELRIAQDRVKLELERKLWEVLRG